MVYEIAGLRIDVKSKYKYDEYAWSEFIAPSQDGKCDFSVSVTDADIENEERHGEPDGYVESICLCREISKRLPNYGRSLLHGAAVAIGDTVYMFVGRSGAGKSTHARLWLKYVPDSYILNGDKPIVERNDDAFIIHGTPWKGKEGYGINRSAKLGGFLFINQAKENGARKLSKNEFAERLLSQIYLPKTGVEALAMLEIADQLVSHLPAYLLDCDISRNAVEHSYKALTGEDLAE